MTSRTTHRRNPPAKQARTARYLITATITACVLLAVITETANAGTTTLNGRNLKSANFQTQDDQILAGCIGAACTSPKIFDPALGLVCPVAAGKTCTYYIHLESQVQVSAQDAGLFRFLVDGAAPSPGPTATDDSFTWLDNDPDSNVLSHFEVKSFTVTAKVTNTTANQSHSIEVQIACSDTNADGGCAAKAGFAVLEVKIHTP